MKGKKEGLHIYIFCHALEGGGRGEIGEKGKEKRDGKRVRERAQLSFMFIFTSFPNKI